MSYLLNNKQFCSKLGITDRKCYFSAQEITAKSKTPGDQTTCGPTFLVTAFSSDGASWGALLNVTLTMGQPGLWITQGIWDTSGLRKQTPELEKARRQDSGPQRCVRDHFTACGFCINIPGKMVLSKFRYVSEKMGVTMVFPKCGW